MIPNQYPGDYPTQYRFESLIEERQKIRENIAKLQADMERADCEMQCLRENADVWHLERMHRLKRQEEST